MNITKRIQTSDSGGVQHSILICHGNYRLACGWVTRWSNKIKFFHIRRETSLLNGAFGTITELHLGRFRIGVRL